MNHPRAQGCLSAYLEDDLSDTERLAVKSHLAGCDGCSEDLRDLRATVALLRRLPVPETPPFLASRVMARIADGETQPSAWRRWLAQAGTPVIAAPLAAAAAALVVFALASPPVKGGGQVEVAVARMPSGPLVPQFTGPVAPGSERPPALPARVVLQDLLARQLRGAGHPYSAELARHFDGPSEAVAASFTVR